MDRAKNYFVCCLTSAKYTLGFTDPFNVEKKIEKDPENKMQGEFTSTISNAQFSTPNIIQKTFQRRTYVRRLL